jgi:hypothetical protein
MELLQVMMRPQSGLLSRLPELCIWKEMNSVWDGIVASKDAASGLNIE